MFMYHAVCGVPTVVKSSTGTRPGFSADSIVKDDCSVWAGTDGGGQEVVIDLGCIANFGP